MQGVLSQMRTDERFPAWTTRYIFQQHGAMLTQLPVICYLVHVPFACPSCALARFQLCNCLFTSSRLVEGVQARGAHCSAVTTAQQAHTRLLQHEAPACIFNAMSEHVSAHSSLQSSWGFFIHHWNVVNTAC